MDLFNQDVDALKKVVTAYRFTDEETLAGIKAIDHKFNYVACPHTAIAYLAVEKYRNENPADESAAVFLSTAHACKFPDIFPEEIAAKIEIPEQVTDLESKPKQADQLGVDFEGFKAYLLKG
ncbi:threonine synthase [compost metagenome]